jgi:hypothetical protein
MAKGRLWQMVWFGGLPAISQLASRLGEEGELSKSVFIALHNLTLAGSGGESSERVAFPPLGFVRSLFCRDGNHKEKKSLG